MSGSKRPARKSKKPLTQDSCPADADVDIVVGNLNRYVFFDSFADHNDARLRYTEEQVKAFVDRLAQGGHLRNLHVTHHYRDHIFQFKKPDLVFNFSGGEPDPQPQRLDVPWLGEVTLRLVLPKKQREAFLGDLEERFHEQVHVRGRRGATRWYWIEVIRALYTLVPTSAKAILFAWFWLKFGR